MIVGEAFVWAHIPKTGGDATAAMLARVPRLVVFGDPPSDHAKHLSFGDRAESVAGKVLVANVRRLPAWALSWMRHREQFGLWPDFEPQGFRQPRIVAEEGAADAWLEAVVGDFDVDVWLRQEHLADDLAGFLRREAALSTGEEAALRSVGRVNEDRPGRKRRLARALRGASTPERFFTPGQIETLYATNPRWAEIERRVYGDDPSS